MSKLCWCDDQYIGTISLEKSIEFLKADDGQCWNTDLVGCQTSFRGKCSCLAMFFHTSSGNCFLLDSVGSSQKYDGTDSGYVSYIKVVTNDGS
ncbi:hypothetical protein KIW84_056906 [Lathyrus oleraceus]|uniref:Apple domain-containing protein n=1 Tax=Pisum sativum TaxID=3888 RepID=A0A9D5ALS4_PEA|nr:hypothetical protein KIW84_056906 [Pisum sativum]